ncbi:hypothetical protein [Mangrovibacterium diazotrophicum]|uniref:Lipoprotein n=1 Tax=Mangrovibacterium diazotrophicum TaxID=1261403 RepID=A0A419W6E2_9BACT|nr:hypothetical protein [Mangrovibacterium diazotrophicum]RKD91041.1 hypothetical protein BC643_1390 [Mangrovibacterium diazotrophicum]
MKTIVRLLFAVLLILASCSKDDDFAPENSNDYNLKSAETRSVNIDFLSEYYGPLICDGEVVDILYVPLESELTSHATLHTSDGKLVWMKVHFMVTITGQLTGETYRVNDQTTLTFDENGEMGMITYHVHAKSDNGSHVNLFFDFDPNDLTFEFIRGVCLQNNAN